MKSLPVTPEYLTRRDFSVADSARILAAVAEAQARGHAFGIEKFSAMADDRRISWRCTRCGDLVVAIAQGRHPLEVNGCATKLGRCPADLKGARR